MSQKNGHVEKPVCAEELGRLSAVQEEMLPGELIDSVTMAHILGIRVTYLYNLLRRNQMLPSLVIGKQHFWEAEAVDEWLKAGKPTENNWEKNGRGWATRRAKQIERISAVDPTMVILVRAL